VSRSSNNAPMTLELESGRTIDRPTEGDIRSGIEAEEFAILGCDANTYIQCQRISPDCDECLLEYRDGSPDSHYEAVDPPIPALRVTTAFIKYLSGDDSWRADFEWEQVDPRL
jgi:hypothetical protein